jgi:hypothetical protein
VAVARSQGGGDSGEGGGGYHLMWDLRDR